jgi:deoxycytidylate deaminase
MKHILPSITENYQLTKRNKKFIELAERIADQSVYPQFKHGAVLVKGSSVINVSCNKNGYNSFGAKFRKKQQGKATLHAELGALLNVERKNTEGATVYCVRINTRGNKRLAKPCTMCEAALKYCGIKKVIYSTNDGFKVMRL